MKKAGLKLVVQLRLSLTFLEKPEFMSYLETLLNIYGKDANGLKQLLPSARTLKRYGEQCAEDAKIVIRTKSSLLANNGRLGLSMDHKRE